MTIVPLLLLPASNAAPPKRVCGGLPYDTLLVGGAPSTLALAFVGNAAYTFLEGGAASPVPQYFALNPVSRSCEPSIYNPAFVSQLRGTSVASQMMVGGDFN